ncbi:uncharacterized protein LOC123310061 [Coccinella septempunctata]|uniref:uncharacterized protein LOC123310061 n=1 Tax=Coccinella septempunctata TaxID=41139 RepID=UPI001D08A6DD|nr:uncharacterized protein LOC123310061 [Coccinella septempunctata]
MNHLGGMDRGNPDDQNRPSVFTDQYPPPMRPPLNWSDIPGTSQSPVNYGTPPSVGYNMQPQGFPVQPNFQFSSNRGNFGRTVQFPLRYVPHRFSMERQILSTMRVKRKTDSPPLQVSKQFITEEKMSQHLSKLRISSETPSEMESEEIKEKRLYMCEEMKKFQAQNDPIIPESLLNRMSRPCTALVLWKPPESILAPSRFDHREEDSENNNNNDDNYHHVEQQVINSDVVDDVEFEEL